MFNYTASERERTIESSTMVRLFKHQAQRDRAAELAAGFQVQQAEAFIVRDIEELKIAIMTHCFQALDYFNHSCSSDCRRGNRRCPNME